MKRQRRFWQLFLAMLTMISLSAAAAGAKPEGKGGKKAEEPKIDAGMLLAPLKGALNIEAGTLEARFALDYSFDDYLRIANSYCVPFSFMQFYQSDGVLNSGHIPPKPSINVFFAQSQGRHSLMYNNSWYYREAADNPSVHYWNAGISGNKVKGLWLRAGEWHTLAVTWGATNQGLRMEFFIDGVFCSGTTNPKKESSVLPPGVNDFLVVGGQNLSAATVQSYRLSNRVRTRAEIASDKPLASDDATIFFINGEIAEKIRPIQNDKFATMKADGKLTFKQPVFIGNVTIVNTPKGKAIQFYKIHSR